MINIEKIIKEVITKFIGTDINYSKFNSVPICRKHTNFSDNVLCVCDIERTKQFRYVNLVRSLFVDFNKINTNIKVHRNDEINKIIILGDLKHEFGTISETEWRQTLRFLDFLAKFCDKIILIKGNHDTILGPIAKKRNLEIVDNYLVDDIFLFHGDKIPSDIPKPAKTIIIGHEHPAISLKQGPRVEKYKCFLKGKFRKYELIVMPSFNPLIEGTDILKENLLSPLLKEADINKLEVFIIGDNVYNFGRIKEIVKQLK